MSVKTDILHKRAFVSLVMTKLTGILTSDKKLMKKLESAKDIHKQYVTAMRYARNHKWGYNALDQDHDKRMWVKELEHKKKKWKDNPECYTDKPIKNIWSLGEVSDAITVAEAEAPVSEDEEKQRVVNAVIIKLNELYKETKSTSWKVEAKKVATQKDLSEGYKVAVDLIKQCNLGIKYNLPVEEESPIKSEAPVEPVTSMSKVPEVEIPVAAPAIEEPYLQVVTWLRAIDEGTVNGTVQEAKQFISSLDGYTDKLQTLVVEQTKLLLKNLLQQVKDCEAVLAKEEIEDIWLEVGTEKGELVVTPYSRETVTPVLNPSYTVEAV